MHQSLAIVATGQPRLGFAQPRQQRIAAALAHQFARCGDHGGDLILRRTGLDEGVDKRGSRKGGLEPGSAGIRTLDSFAGPGDRRLDVTAGQTGVGADRKVDALVSAGAPEEEIVPVIAAARELVHKSGGNSLLPRLREAEARLAGRSDRELLASGLREAEAMYRAMVAPDPAERLAREIDL